jgi:hypothetical protein
VEIRTATNAGGENELISGAYGGACFDPEKQSYLPAMFSAMPPMIGSMNFSC